MISENNPDITTISETWLKPEIQSNKLLPEGYNVFRNDRLHGYGGVLLACHDSVNHQQLNIASDTEDIAVEQQRV